MVVYKNVISSALSQVLYEFMDYVLVIQCPVQVQGHAHL